MSDIEQAKKLFFEALSFIESSDFQNAELRLRDALQFSPGSISILTNLAIVLLQQNKHGEAREYAEKAISIKANDIESLLVLGDCYAKDEKLPEALFYYGKCISLDQTIPEAYNNCGIVLAKLGRIIEALDHFDRAIALDTKSYDAHTNRGNALRDLKRYEEAIAAYDKALARKPDLEGAWLGRGNVFSRLKRYDEASAAYDKAFAIKPDLAGLEGIRLHAKLLLCDWKAFDVECARLISSIRRGNANAQPFSFLTIPSSSVDQLKCAKLWAANTNPSFDKPIWQGERYNHDRIRIAYLSADFHQHAMSSLLVGMYECHDRSRFDVTAISVGSDDNSEMRQRLKVSFERFIDAKAYSDDQIAKLVRSLEVDILIDLMGFTADARTGVFARRVAPLQVNYLGYPGTMGVEYIDYIIADRIVIPENQHGSYSENIVYLPNSFLPADRQRRISDKKIAREEVGLPSEGFVFCCFNNNYKITPDVFDIWMRILKQVDASVLWLFAGNSTSERNLRNEAISRGVKAERLIFAPHLPYQEYLARLRLADLFLDTLPYNAGATASDALWVGLPVLTRIGDTLAGRMATSLLNAIDLPELVTTTSQQYEALAVTLATYPDKLAGIKQKLAKNRLTTSLFDTALFTKHIESAYTTMYERHQAGLAPAHLCIPGR